MMPSSSAKTVSQTAARISVEIQFLSGQYSWLPPSKTVRDQFVKIVWTHNDTVPSTHKLKRRSWKLRCWKRGSESNGLGQICRPHRCAWNQRLGLEPDFSPSGIDKITFCPYETIRLQILPPIALTDINLLSRFRMMALKPDKRW